MSKGLSRRKFLQDSTVVAAAATAAGALVASNAVASQAGSTPAKEYKTMTVTKKGQVATITLDLAYEGGGHRGWALGEVFDDLRVDNSVRVIVLTGEKDGIFGTSPTVQNPNTTRAENVSLDDYSATEWRTFQGIVHSYEAMVAIEKPIVARWNGDAEGYNGNLLFACDIVVAREDAVYGDHHLGPLLIPSHSGPINSNEVPGDGGCVWLPIHMSPFMAKETLMLAKPHTAKELAQMGIINHAVPAAQLDKTVNDIVERLLQRPAYALAWTKKVINQHYVDRMNLALNTSGAYEMVCRAQKKLGLWDGDKKRNKTLGRG
ncbi:MAG: enoyl-CoA hydratase/isomerase family protein [Acidobacteria bacterium]|nr:enoyl-CoA hydratase/isomerase family protein [Acidobacteriota bacterium]